MSDYMLKGRIAKAVAQFKSLVVDTFTCTGNQSVGGALTVAGLITGDFLKLSSEDGITATPGGGKPGARPLTKSVNRITTCSPSDSVLLPPGQLGMVVIIMNSTANAPVVFGSGSDQVNDAVSVTHPTQKAALYFYAAPNKWYRVFSV